MLESCPDPDNLDVCYAPNRSNKRFLSLGEIKLQAFPSLIPVQIRLHSINK